MELYAWQRKEVEEHALIPKRALFCSPRTGKTLATVESLRRFIESLPPGAPCRVLVVAPLTYVGDWADYLEEFGPCERFYRTRAADAHAFLKEYNRDKKRKVSGVQSVAISYERLANVRRERRDDAGNCTSVSQTGCVDQLLNWRPHVVIIDEAHRISGVSSKQARACRRLAWQAAWVRTLTGTPVPNHPGSLWGHMVCIDPETWGDGAYTRFAEEALEKSTVIKGKVLGWKDEAAKNKFEENIKSKACIVSREDVFGPDSWTYRNRKAVLPQKARRVYDDLAEKWLAEIEQGLHVEAKHRLTRMMRLQQVACGFTKDENGTLHTLHNAKALAICDDLSEIIAQDEKVVIFYKYVREGEIIKNEIQKRYRHIWFSHIDGATTADSRKESAMQFNAEKAPAVILAHIKTLSEGVSLASANHVFYASQTFSFILEEQSRDRVYKVGVNGKALARCVTYYRASHTIEDYVAKIVAQKRPMHDAIMTINRQDLGIQ